MRRCLCNSVFLHNVEQELAPKKTTVLYTNTLPLYAESVISFSFALLKIDGLNYRVLCKAYGEAYMCAKINGLFLIWNRAHIKTIYHAVFNIKFLVQLSLASVSMCACMRKTFSETKQIFPYYSIIAFIIIISHIPYLVVYVSMYYNGHVIQNE